MFDRKFGIHALFKVSFVGSEDTLQLFHGGINVAVAGRIIRTWMFLCNLVELGVQTELGQGVFQEFQDGRFIV